MPQCRRDQTKFATFLLVMVTIETLLIFLVMHLEHVEAERLAVIKRSERATLRQGTELQSSTNILGSRRVLKKRESIPDRTRPSNNVSRESEIDNGTIPLVIAHHDLRVLRDLVNTATHNKAAHNTATHNTATHNTGTRNIATHSQLHTTQATHNKATHNTSTHNRATHNTATHKTRSFQARKSNLHKTQKETFLAPRSVRSRSFVIKDSSL